MDELVLGLNAAGLICSKKILEGTEDYDRLFLVGLGILLVDIDGLVMSVLIGDELPAFKVNMRNQIFTPGRFNRWLECQHQNLREPHFLGQLIGGEGLPEAHLCIPQELRCVSRICFLCVLEIAFCPHNSTLLLRTHLEGPGTGSLCPDAGLQFNDGSLHVTNGTVVPLVIVRNIQLLEAFAFKDRVNIVIHEDGSILAHGRLGIEQLIRHMRSAKLLFYTGVDITFCITDLDITFMNIRKAINVDCRLYSWTLYKEFLHHYSSPPSIDLIMFSI